MSAEFRAIVPSWTPSYWGESLHSKCCFRICDDRSAPLWCSHCSYALKMLCTSSLRISCPKDSKLVTHLISWLSRSPHWGPDLGRLACSCLYLKAPHVPMMDVPSSTREVSWLLSQKHSLLVGASYVSRVELSLCDVWSILWRGCCSSSRCSSRHVVLGMRRRGSFWKGPFSKRTLEILETCGDFRDSREPENGGNEKQNQILEMREIWRGSRFCRSFEC